MIAAAGLRKSFAGRPVVRDLDLTADAGRVLAVLGPSGCGKTTTLRMLAGLTAPDAGTVRVGGIDVTTLPPHRRGVAMVFQQPAFLPGRSVAENIAYPLATRSRQTAVQLAERFRVSHLLDRDPFTLSGGEQQRVALARALAKDARVLLLDEPLAALDARLRDELREVLLELRDESRALVYVTHDQDDARQLGDQILVMNDGRAEQLGTPDEVYSDPRSLFVATFVGSPRINTFRGTLHPEGEGVRLAALGGSVKLDRFRRPPVDGEEVTVAVRPEDVRFGAARDGELELTCDAVESHRVRVGGEWLRVVGPASAGPVLSAGALLLFGAAGERL